MHFTHFRFQNFKGISDQRLDFTKNAHSKVFTLVGLNESGKTTILEAINYFRYKQENLDALDLVDYKVNDVHDLIPISKRDNFNGSIVIQAGIELDDNEISEIDILLKTNNIQLKTWTKHIDYTQTYSFKKSIYQKELSRDFFNHKFVGKVGRRKNAELLMGDDMLLIHRYILKKMPSILYFPNFLFEFPERIYLDEDNSDKKHKFFQTIIQDVLDSLGNSTNVKEHLIDRIASNDEKEKRNLTSLIGKMQRQLTDLIFTKWNQILKKKISKFEVILYTGKDSEGTYLEFNIKDDVDTYRIVERSLGFRWFFVYILLTQFRSFRKVNNDAFFLFDEPASNLHPSAQLELLKSFERLPKVLYTTHSHYLINPMWLENTYVIKNEAIDYNEEENYSPKNTDVRIHKYREFAVNHPNQSNYFQPILEVLDYKPANLELVPKVIITEGKNDFYTFNYIKKYALLKDYKLNFIPGSTSTNMEQIISLYLGWGAKFIVLLDSDKEGLRQKERYLELFGISLKGSIVTYSEVDHEWTETASERLFNKNEQLNIQTACYPDEKKFNKKTFNRSIQELFIKNKLIDLSDSTLANFARLFTFLSDTLEAIS